MNQIHKQLGRVAALSEKFQSIAKNYIKPSSLMLADFSDFKAGIIKEYDELLIEHDEVLHYFVTEEITNNIDFNFSIADDRLKVLIDGTKLTTLDGNAGYIRNTLKTLKDQFNIQVKDVDLFLTHKEHDGHQSMFKVPTVSTVAEAGYLTRDEILSNRVSSKVSLPEIPEPYKVKIQSIRDFGLTIAVKIQLEAILSDLNVEDDIKNDFINKADSDAGKYVIFAAPDDGELFVISGKDPLKLVDEAIKHFDIEIPELTVIKPSM